MKKFLSVFTLFLCLLGTWFLMDSKSDVDFETHSSIQIQFATMIENALIKHRPHFQNLRIQKIWTENIGEGRVKAHYQYTFDDVDISTSSTTTSPSASALTSSSTVSTSSESPANPTQKNQNPLPPSSNNSNESGVLQTISGEAILKRVSPNSLSDSDTWIVETVQTQEGVLVFKDGTLITPENTSEASESKTNTPKTPTSPQTSPPKNTTSNTPPPQEH